MFARLTIACLFLIVVSITNSQFIVVTFGTSIPSANGRFNNTMSLTNEDVLKWNNNQTSVTSTRYQMETTVTQAGYLMLILFFLISVGVALAIGGKYLAARPSYSPYDPRIQQRNESSSPLNGALSAAEVVDEKKLIKKQYTRAEKRYEEWTKEQNFSATLAGFTISALVFILAIEKSPVLQSTIEFFSIAFILEILAFLCYRIQTYMGYEYFATLMQFGGSLALINGFLIFIIEKSISTNTIIPWTVVSIFVIGYIGFFIFIILNLKNYMTAMWTYD